jgi:uroporphyrinogen-III synthase
MRIWITRSQPGADRLARVLEQKGHNVLVRPVIDIESTPAPVAPGHFDVAIVLSEHGAKYGIRHLGNSDRVIAVGASTAAALGKVGVDCVTPKRASSEGVLDMDLLTPPPAQVLIVCGEHPRGLLEQTLVSRGAAVTMAFVYRRRVVDDADLDVVVDPESIDAIVVASGEGLENTARWWSRAGGDPSIPVFAPSARVVEGAAKVNMLNVINCGGADAASVAVAIKQYQAI